ncbi:MAG: DUF3572 family protein [Hyphomicrobiales bacterium]
MTRDEAEMVGLKALQFLARDEERFTRFLALSGTSPQDIAAIAGERHFLAGVVEHLLTDESLLFLFVSDEDLEPDAPAQAQRALADPMAE